MKPWVHRTFGVAIAMLWLLLLGFGNLSKVPAIVLVNGGYALVAAVGVFLGLVLHEGGHVLAGLLLGMKFEQVVVMGWTLARTKKGFKFSGRPFTDRGGAAYLIPKSTRALRLRSIMVSIAGPLGSLVGLALGLYLLIWNYRDDLQNVNLVVFGSLFSAACGYQLSVALRTRPNGYYTDAERVVALLRMTPPAKKILASKVLSLAVRTEDDSESRRLFGEALQDYGDGVAVADLAAILEKSLTRGWGELAGQCETLLLAREGKERLSAKSELAFTYMRHRRDPERARDYLPARTDYEGHPDKSWFYAATLIAFAHGDFQTSLRLANEVVAGEALIHDRDGWFGMAKQRSEYRLTEMGRRFA